MPRDRVQVRDLEAPERIQPGPVKSDIYTKPAPPVPNGDLEALQKGLALFGSSMSALHEKNKAEAEKNLKLQQLAEYERWKAGTSHSDQLDAIRAGKAPWWSSPLIGAVVRKDYVQLEGQRLAGEVDEDRAAGRAAFGSAGFDVDAYVRQKAAPYVERVGQDPQAMAYFGDVLDTVRKTALGEHQKMLGAVQTKALEDRGFREFRDVIASGAANGLTPTQISTQLRSVYKNLGPLSKGGALDLPYGKQDELLLQALEELAKSPETARTAFALVDEPRLALDGKTALPALSGAYSNRDKVRGIQTSAVKTLGDAAEETAKAEVHQSDRTALALQDGSFASLQDIDVPNPLDPSKRIKITREQRQKQAVQSFIDDVRAKNRGVPNFDEEFGVLMRNGMKHPQYAKLFNETYAGLLTTNDGSPEQLQKIKEVAQLYSKIADLNWAHAQEYVSNDAKRFFETYRTLTRFADRTPEAAAAQTAAALSSPLSDQQTRTIQGNLDNIRSKVRAMDMKPWWPGGGVVNRQQVVAMMEPIMDALSRVEGVSEDEVINRALDHIKNTSAYVNGRIVFSPGFTQEQVPAAQIILDTIFEESKGHLAGVHGIDSADQLSFFPYGKGMVVTKWDGGIIDLPLKRDPLEMAEGQQLPPLGTFPRLVVLSDIQKVSKAASDRAEAEAVVALKAEIAREEARENTVRNSPWSPEAHLRRLFGTDKDAAADPIGKVVSGIKGGVEAGIEASSRERSRTNLKPKPLGKK